MASRTEEGHVHAVPLRVLAGVWLLLVFLTWLTVSVTKVDLGSANIIIALIIAVVKSAFVALFFMHLKYDKPFNAVIFVSAMLFVVLFITMALLDTKSYQDHMIPGYAPAIEEAQAAQGTE